jgi:outer membrane murein-binding lipoprotein Lpp
VKGGPVRAAQVRIAELEAQLAQFRANFNAFRFPLHSAKFTGAQADGSRKDWIATADVLSWLFRY